MFVAKRGSFQLYKVGQKSIQIREALGYYKVEYLLLQTEDALEKRVIFVAK